MRPACTRACACAVCVPCTCPPFCPADDPLVGAPAERPQPGAATLPKVAEPHTHTRTQPAPEARPPAQGMPSGPMGRQAARRVPADGRRLRWRSRAGLGPPRLALLARPSSLGPPRLALLAWPASLGPPRLALLAWRWARRRGRAALPPRTNHLLAFCPRRNHLLAFRPRRRRRRRRRRGWQRAGRGREEGGYPATEERAGGGAGGGRRRGRGGTSSERAARVLPRRGRGADQGVG